MADKATALKEEGNKCFQVGNFQEAETFYTRAYGTLHPMITRTPTADPRSIQKDPSNPKLFTNRAMTRLKLQAWDACIDDCLKSIELEPGNMKGYYYLAQAQLALHHPNEALNSAMTAYEECLKTDSSSTRSVSTLVLQAKKEKWEAKERERIRRRSALLEELEDGLDKVARDELHQLHVRVGNGNVNENEAMEEKEEIETSSRKKIEELRNVFGLADPAFLQKREVPDYMIDNISFAIMHDPVVTKNGQSYDRATMLQHLRHSETDPLTREPLTLSDLRPNLALRQACEEFLDNNGWAVDW